MATEIPQVRPPVISANTRALLSDFCRFRHVVRHIYGFQLDAEQLHPLVEAAPTAFTQINFDLMTFAQFLLNRQ